MIILICGLPKSGKTQYSLKFKNVLHLDQLKNYTNALLYLMENDIKENFILEGVYNRRYLRSQFLDCCSQKEEKCCIWLDTPLEIRKQRPGYFQGCDIPFEPPTLQQGWDKIIIIRDKEVQQITK